MKAVAYLRVSSDDQSLNRQYDDVKKFASDKSLQLVKIFEDKISGSKTNADDRGGFQQMESFINSHKDIKHLLVLEISRLGRKNNDIQNVVERYIEKGICIHIHDLNISTLEPNGNRSAIADMLVSLMGAMAANEARLLSSRIRSGKMSRARENKAFSSKIIGYKKSEEGTPIIDEEQAPMVRRVFEITANGLGMRSVSAMIQKEFGKKVSIATLSGIVRNSFHKGERKYNGLILEVPPIVSKELWQKANDSIDSRSKYGSKTQVYTNIVEGRIKCHCGNPLYQKVIPTGRLNHYVCSNEDCRNSINRPWLFRMIKKVVERHAKKSRDKQYRDEVKLRIDSYKSQISINEGEQKKLVERRRKFQIIWVDGDISDLDYTNHKNTIEKEIKNLSSDNQHYKEIIEGLENDLNSEIKHFSDDLELFKGEIKDIINYVEIDEKNVIINVLGRWDYDLHKPNPSKLGWEARKPIEKRYLNETLPLRFPIENDTLEIMTNKELNENYDHEVDMHLKTKK